MSRTNDARRAIGHSEVYQGRPKRPVSIQGPADVPEGNLRPPLDETELEIFCRSTGQASYVPQEHSEATIVAGRRSGKSSKIAATIACYEALRDHGLPRGERALVALVAPLTAQARIDYRYIRHYFQNSPILSKRVLKVRKDEIELDNGISIVCLACSYVAVRGETVVAAVLDELAFWRDEETAANPAQEVIDSLRPAMATSLRTKLIKISSPFGKDGLLWREFRERAHLDFLVFQVPTWEMNPGVSLSVLEKERQRDPEKFEREYGAVFTDHITGWISPETLEPCIIRGRSELPRVEDGRYVAAIDPAFQRNDFALAVLHRASDGRIIVDRIARWAGSKKAPLGYVWVCGQIKQILEQYGINSLVGDQFCAAVIKQHFLSLGIHYKEFSFSSRTRADLFGNLKHLLVQRRIELLDEPELLRQLRALEEQKASSGQVDIRPGHGKDDLAVAVALGAFELAQSVSEPVPIIFGRVRRPWDHRLPPVYGERGGYPLGPPPCGKFPKCWDDWDCECYDIHRT